jgi:hypothetical protein
VITLNDYAKAAKSPLAKGFIKDLLRASDLLKIIPIDTVDGLQVAGTRWQTMPSVAFRKIGGAYTESSGAMEEVAETLVALGGDVKIDRLLVKAKNTKYDPLQQNMRMKAQAIALAIYNGVINGDQAVDPDSFEGLKKRISNMPARQTVNLYNIDAGDGYPILKDATHEHTFLDALHEILYKTNANYLLCNEAVYLGLGKLLRRLGLLETSTDAYGKKWNTFQGVPLVDVGLLSDKTTEIITNTENPGDGGNDCTSIYAVNFNTDDGVHLLQLAGTSPEPYDPNGGGESDSGPQYLRRIDWAVGMFNLSQYCAARLCGFRVAAV